jgi:hypothetical protein
MNIDMQEPTPGAWLYARKAMKVDENRKTARDKVRTLLRDKVVLADALKKAQEMQAFLSEELRRCNQKISTAVTQPRKGAPPAPPPPPPPPSKKPSAPRRPASVTNSNSNKNSNSTKKKKKGSSITKKKKKGSSMDEVIKEMEKKITAMGLRNRANRYAIGN